MLIPPVALLDLENGADEAALALEIEDVYLLGGHDALALAPPMPPVRRQLVRSRILTNPFVNGLQIYADGCSHLSGHQRLFVVCGLPEHSTAAGTLCRKYINLRDFDSEDKAMAWLYAWKVDGQDLLSRAAHRLTVPSRSRVDEVVQTFMK